MDEVNVLELHQMVQNNGPNKKKKKKRRKYKDEQKIQISSSRRRGVSIGVVLRWLGSGIILYIDIF